MTDKPENPKVLKRRRELERRLQKAGRAPSDIARIIAKVNEPFDFS